MSLIQINDLSFTYDGGIEPVFEHVSLRLDTAWRLGLTGRNGRGKTTLLRLLWGELPDGGAISATVGFSYFPYKVPDRQAPALDTVLSVSGALEWEARRELSRLELEEHAFSRAFSLLSGGEQVKVLLAALFLRTNQFLLLDEPTNHLDEAARDAVARYLSSKEGFILVSHDRAFLDRAVDHIMAINKTSIDLQQGNFSSWWENKSRQNQFEAARNEKLLREAGRYQKAARRTAGWSDKLEKSKKGVRGADRGYIGHQSAKMMKRAKAIEARQMAAAEEAKGLLHDVERAEKLKLSPLPLRQKKVLAARDLRLFYGDHMVCGPLSFTVEEGDRVWLRGPNGSGKTTLLRLIAGEPAAHTGDFWAAAELIVSYVRQDTSELSGSLSDWIDKEGLDESLFKAILRKLDFSRSLFAEELSRYSEGQKKKVLIAGSLSRRAHLYLWDEPLNYIDVFSRMQLEELLRDSQATVLFVEHDRAFSQAAANQVILLPGAAAGSNA